MSMFIDFSRPSFWSMFLFPNSCNLACKFCVNPRVNSIGSQHRFQPYVLETIYSRLNQARVELSDWLSEYHNKTISRLFGGNSRLGCYALAATIFSLGVFRDYLYNEALAVQPTHPTLLSPLVKYAAIPLFLTGNTLVITSMWALGVTGTYLGDYFGILMDEPVTSFPFNVSEAPMYHGSTLSFLATALWYGKPAGVLLTALVAAAYGVARRWEDPFTGMIYAKRDKARRQGNKSQ